MMPSSQVFAVNNRGRVFSLSTDQSHWKELVYLGVEFKRVSAHETVLWALGGDHQVYVYVYGSSVPIRVCEESYENQRWNPIEGFTGVLLPSDRATYSSGDGLTDRRLAGITLPTLAWSWESSWHLHHTHNGQALDKEGWTYAIDFPRTYTAEKRWNSCVRRRKWVRYRRYVALDTWSAVPPIHHDPTEEPFIDITVGGGEVPGDDPDRLMVWGVTALGRVMVREGVDGTCPEGCGWMHIQTPPDHDVTSVWVGRSGRVWAVTWDGTPIVRTGVTRDCPTGTDWVVVEPPKGSRLQQVAVGVNSVWAVTRDHRVWFRRGLQVAPDSSSDNGKLGNGAAQRSTETGTTWLLMVGFLNMVAIGPNDQVWGIGNEDHTALLRTGITETELTGRTWRPICLPIGPLETPEASVNPSPIASPLPFPSPKLSVSVDSKDPSTSVQQDSLTSSLDQSLRASDEIDFISMETALMRIKHQENGKRAKDKNEESAKEEDKGECGKGGSGGDQDTRTQSESNEVLPSDDSLESNIKIRYPEDYPSSLSSSVVSDPSGDFLTSLQVGDGSVVLPGDTPAESPDTEPGRKNQVTGDVNSQSSDDREKTETDDLREKTETDDEREKTETNDNASPLVQQQASAVPSGDWCESRLRHTSSSSGGSEAGPGRGSLVIPREEGPSYKVVPLEAEHLWLWVTGGGCWIRANNMPKWFVTEGSPVLCTEPWRVSILERLRQRYNQEIKPYIGYEEAVEGSSWVIAGQCRWWVAGQWVPASIELVMVGSRRSQVQDATFIVRYSLGSQRVEETSCSVILMSVMCVEPLASRSLVALYQPNQPLQPKTLSFSAETDAEDWLNHLSTACNQFRGMTERPSSYTVWAVTTQGDVFLHDCSVTENELRAESVAGHKQLDVGTGATPLTLLLDRGFRPGHYLSVSGKIYNSADQFHINLQTSRGTDTSIALHINPRFFQKSVVFNSKKKGIWGHEEHSDLGPLSPGSECEISILCCDDDLKISLNDKFWHSFKHRIPFERVTHLTVRGSIAIDAVTYNHGAGERQLNEWYWRGLGGHLKRVESGANSVTWGISLDFHVYIYTGATGGGLYKSSSNDAGVQIMSDVRHVYVWENQRWNPVTGFTNRGLPTDRNTWSDQTGRIHRTRENAKLPSRHWSWTSEWCVDYHTPGGVDREGWQYATDFPMCYHAHRYVTDLVRRRRWVRKCRMSTSGPWQQMEKVALVHVSISPECADDGSVPVWGVSVTGEVVIRQGVRAAKYEGERWSLVPAECPMCSVCAGVESCGVWAVSKDGRAHLRLGVTKKNPQGTQWVNVDSPGQPLVEVGAGAGRVWGLDREGSLYRRTDVLPLFPEGTNWERVSGNVTSFSVGADGSLWAVLESYECGKLTVQGVIAHRVGITESCPSGTGWEHTVGTGWSAVCARVPLPL
ncbi:tectonin beta-propeller repeat-containing protein 1-like isoform X2 [Homarus americanus]|nr:tectonin beta-propeller repeat-containing protein 1-like isoform X2 [Homarus americanus]XP_042223769.1 tectonin beta-propeller repeat-containing protein 1-like isoform X2 [Homarus americanus]